MRYRRRMQPIAAGFWGAFFGTAALMLSISLAVFLRTRRRVALIAGLTAVGSALFVAGFLAWLPEQGDGLSRAFALVVALTTAALVPMLLGLLGMLRQRRMVWRTWCGSFAAAGVLIAVGWLLAPIRALALSWAVTVVIGGAMLILALRMARRGSRSAYGTAASIFFMILGVAGLTWIAEDRAAGQGVHALTALAGIGYLSMLASVAWARYSYLLELSEVMAHGPSYDPVTRMRSHSETGQMVGDMFFHRDAEARPVGVLAICIGNLYALENLHGRAAFNHALFICAGRLRRCVPETVEMGRLGEDGFLLLTRSMDDMRALGQLARHIRDRLQRPVSVSISGDPGRIGTSGTSWVADVGIGVLSTSTKVRPAQAVATVRAMARTAWTYSTRVAMFDAEAGQIAELSVDDNVASVV
jgi:GGDEF domain-containing protein